jgi:hypothetical protein
MKLDNKRMTNMAQDVLLSLYVPVKGSPDDSLLFDGFKGIKLVGFRRFLDDKDLTECSFTNFFVKLE